MRNKLVILLVSVLIISSCNQQDFDPANVDVSTRCSNDVTEQLTEAYIYGFPLVMMEMTKIIATNVNPSNPNGAPVNQLFHNQNYPDENYTSVVRASVDILYSSAWLDLRAEPMVLDLPDTQGRYSLFPILDAWTNVISSPGTRNTGGDAQTYIITGPDWNGTVPPNMSEIKSPTYTTWLIGRIQVNNKEDGETVVKSIQEGMRLTPLSAYGSGYIPPAPEPYNPGIGTQPPSMAIFNLSIEDFFNKMNELMVNNPPARADVHFLRSLHHLGIDAGRHFKINRFSPAMREELANIPQTVKNRLLGILQSQSINHNGWSNLPDLGNYGTNYGIRAGVAYIGLGANKDEDAIYFSTYYDLNGAPLDASQYNYKLHFEANEIPPVNAFWSLSAYNQNSFFMGNELDRFSIGSRDSLIINEDGSLDLYLQYENPGSEFEANWLPVQNGIFNLTMRLYWPTQEVLNEQWVMPPLIKTTR